MAVPSCLPPVPQREKDNLPWLLKASGSRQEWPPCMKPKTIILKTNRRFSMKKLNNAVRNRLDSTIRKARQTLSNQRGDFYISDAVKIIIAVVLGALLLAALTNIFNGTVIPRITQVITQLFG